MIDKLMAETANLQYEQLSFVFMFGVASVAVLTVMAFVLPRLKKRG